MEDRSIADGLGSVRTNILIRSVAPGFSRLMRDIGHIEAV
jgi:hypothetical protein